jgi:hypothetical protein
MHSVELLPILQATFPAVSSYNTVASVIQANAEGHRVLLTLDNQDGENHPNDVFLKQVVASKYTEKSWPDLRRTLLYLRTEVRFYKEMVPLMALKGFEAAPEIYAADYSLDGWITQDEKATDPALEPHPDVSLHEGRGGHIVMESISEKHYFQDSPISVDRAKECLSAVAQLHAAAWEDPELLQKAEDWLSRGSYHLKTRNPKELAGMEEAWTNFASHFAPLNPELFEKTQDLGKRIYDLAEYISDEVSPRPNDPYATLSHGDFKAMNCFMPKTSDGERCVILVDYASTGVGLGMSDVAMHIHHAVKPADLADGGEQELIDHYLDTLNACLGDDTRYPREVAMRHYRLAMADYFRFFLGRFWKSATPEAFEKKRNSKNTALINRDVDAALAFLERVDGCVAQIEKERAMPSQ